MNIRLRIGSNGTTTWYDGNGNITLEIHSPSAESNETEEPYATHAALFSSARMKVNPVTGDISIGTPPSIPSCPPCHGDCNQGRDCPAASQVSITENLIYRLRKRAEIRRQIPSRKSVQENQPDRIADLLEEAANEIERLRNIGSKK